MAQMTIQQAIELGMKLHQAGNLREAELIYRQILSGHPKNADALHLLGMLTYQTQRLDEALDLCRRAVKADPNRAGFHHNLGTVLAGSGQLREAIASFEQALRLRPELPEALRSLADAHNALGGVLMEAGQVQQAEVEYRRSIQLIPDDPRPHFNLAYALLLQGHLREGWIEHEWRQQMQELQLYRPVCPQPAWDGSPLNGRRILVYAEQGFGDTIQFVRYLPLVHQRGGEIILQCPPHLMRLLESLKPSVKLIPDDAPLPADFDVHIPLISLPRIFDTTLETIPAPIPYLHPEPDLVERWRERLTNEHRPKVGLVWSGRQIHQRNRHRSIPRELLAPLGTLANICFISLQKHEPGAPSSHDKPFAMIDWTNELNDFTDTAALIENLDLVITIDTAVAHLAGAMGKKVWVMLPYVPDWRWMLDRNDSPWYPTMKLFRQPKVGDWDSVIHSLLPALQSLTT